MLYVRVRCFVVRGCAVSVRYIQVRNCDMFSVVHEYLDHLKFCGVCINGRMYVWCSECYVVSNECNEPTSCLVEPIGTHGGEVMYFGCVCFRGMLGFLNCDACVSCISSLSSSSLFLIPFMLTCSMMIFLSILLLGLCPCVVSLSCGRLRSVVAPYVDSVVAVTVVRVLLFVLHVCMLRECEGDGNAGVGE